MAKDVLEAITGAIKRENEQTDKQIVLDEIGRVSPAIRKLIDDDIRSGQSMLDGLMVTSNRLAATMHLSGDRDVFWFKGLKFRDGNEYIQFDKASVRFPWHPAYEGVYTKRVDIDNQPYAEYSEYLPTTAGLDSSEGKI